ncbi:MAG TPA: transglycosylase SLT domain-containing protein [Bryobacteraceae bacterium]|nr:transglycosylase SLT domain-containing protein [Bryobacteraceae bacterium]
MRDLLRVAIRLTMAWLALPATVFAQGPQAAGQAYRDSPSPARRLALERFAAAHKDVNGALAHLNLGIAAYEQKRYPDAIQHLEAARARLPKLADYTAYYLAAARVEASDPAGAARDAAEVRRAPVRSPFAGKAMVLEARGLAASGSAANAISLLREHYADIPQPDGDVALGDAYQAAGDLKHAAEYYQRVYYEYPSGDAATRAAAALLTLRDSMGSSYPEPSAQALVERGDKLLALGEYRRARAEFQSLVPQLAGAERDQARVGIGAAEYLNGEVASAYSFLNSLEVSSPEADAQRLYYIVVCVRRLNDDDQMMEAVHKLDMNHRQSMWRYKALAAAANGFLVQNQYEKYVPLYHAIYESFADQPLAAASHWRVTWSAYIHRQHDAQELLRQHLERYPAHPTASAALYFLGRLAEVNRDYAAARAFYIRLAAQFPNYYYGILARQRMTQPAIVGAGASPKAAQFLETIAFPHRSAISSRPDAGTALRISRASLLVSAGLRDLAQAELRFGARTGSQPYLLAMELARIATTPHEKLHSIKVAAPDYLALSMEDAPLSFWRLLFPLPYRQELVRSAAAHSLDPYMLAAIIRQESEFDPQALSAKHAYGLIQVEPATGRALARRAGVRRFSNRSLFQPAVNLKLGSYYLRGLLDQWGGKWEEALASYNAGKSRVNDWVTWNQYREPAEFVESIPFAETREYVEAVLRNATVYRQLYGNKAPRVQETRRAGRSTARRL